jgi:hypothetical protein
MALAQPLARIGVFGSGLVARLLGLEGVVV